MFRNLPCPWLRWSGVWLFSEDGERFFLLVFFYSPLSVKGLTVRLPLERVSCRARGAVTAATSGGASFAFLSPLDFVQRY